MFFYEVLVIDKFCRKPYIYALNYDISSHVLVKVEFGKKKAFGIIVKKAERIENFKYICEVLDYKISSVFLDFLKYMSSYYFLAIGAVLELSFPAISFRKSDLSLEYKCKNGVFELAELLDKKITKKAIKEFEIYKSIAKDIHKIILDEDQENAVKFLIISKKPTLLNGMTGSGKTIVALKSVMQFKNKVLILVPEINLVSNWARILKEHFGILSHIYHSKVKDTYKKAVYNWAISEESGFIIGTRSALMIPYNKLDAVIVDEEHSSSYKQENYPYYHARDMVILRSFFEKNKVILLSATPSLETMNNIRLNKYEEYRLKRKPKHGLSKVTYIKGIYSKILSPEIIKQVYDRFENKQQVLFFLNRKGYAPYCVCNNCKYVLSCNHCNHPKTLYRDFKVICHKCLHYQALSKICPSCKQSIIWNFFGLGVERVQDYLCEEFKGHVFKSVTCDTENIDIILNDIENNKIDGIIATQILSQGHDFKNIGLVVIVDGDMGLSSINFRSLEHVYQLWQQIRGRSGRHNIQGEMIIQYFHNENKFISLFKKDNIYEYLLNDRKVDNWPPFSRCAFLKFKGKKKEKVEKDMEAFKLISNEIFGPFYYGICRNIHEFRYLVKCNSYAHLSNVLKSVQNQNPRIEIEVDPYSF